MEPGVPARVGVSGRRGRRREGEGNEAVEDAGAASGLAAWGPGLAALWSGLGSAHLARGSGAALGRDSWGRDFPVILRADVEAGFAFPPSRGVSESGYSEVHTLLTRWETVLKNVKLGLGILFSL